MLLRRQKSLAVAGAATVLFERSDFDLRCQWSPLVMLEIGRNRELWPSCGLAIVQSGRALAENTEDSKKAKVPRAGLEPAQPHLAGGF